MVNNSQNKQVRTRIAPSPTGSLHIGTARTALFNWLFARKMGGKFILRIEDTDLERSKKEYEHDIVKNLKWLGIDWDEGPDPANIEKYIGQHGPYRQTQKLDSYEKRLKELLDNGKAYYCFCTKEQLEADRQEMMAKGEAPRYSGRCSSIPKDEAFKKAGAGEPSVIRFKIGTETVVFRDMIRGELSFDMGLTGDIVVAKNLRAPLYNFAVVIDDFEMDITHVVRGEDHISNTPKQIMIQRALGFPEIEYAHLPLILAPDRSKMSKRFGASTIAEYKAAGFLPEALFNFIALLGWHPEDDGEILGKDELVNKFSLERVQKAGAVFDQTKLEWLNGEYLRKMPLESLAQAVRPFMPEAWTENKVITHKALSIERERMKKLTDFTELAGFFYDLPEYAPDMLNWKSSPAQATKESLEEVFGALQSVSEADFNKEKLEAVLSPIAEKRGKGEVFWPLRVSLSGKKASPGPVEILDALGKERSLKRVTIALDKLHGTK